MTVEGSRNYHGLDYLGSGRQLPPALGANSSVIENPGAADITVANVMFDFKAKVRFVKQRHLVVIYLFIH